jgi:hypothetical protein
MIERPPDVTPFYQLNPIVVSVVIVLLLTSEIGGLGTNTQVAPFPGCEKIPDPY